MLRVLSTSGFFWVTAAAAAPDFGGGHPLTTTAGTASCHPLTTEHDRFTPSELSLLVVADDFVPAGDTLTTVTTSGVYWSLLSPDVDATPGCRQRSVDPIADPVDKFRIRIYADTADDGDADTPAGLPGNFVAQRFASSTGTAWGVTGEGTVSRTEDADGPNTLFYGDSVLTDEDYEIDLSADPITGLILDGRTYWIEIVNDLLGYSDCAWSINHASAGNGYAALGSWNYPNGSVLFDLTFCLNVDISDPTPPTGACCDCSSGGCTGDTTLDTCLGAGQTWFLSESCADVIGSGRCTNGPPPNDSCATAYEIGPGLDIDADPEAGTVRIPTVHTCATTSLPDVSVCTERVGSCSSQCDEHEGTVITNDLWYKFVAPTDCSVPYSVLVNGCYSGVLWDSVVAMYAGPEGTGICPCPTDVTTCEAVAFPGAAGATANDDGCSNGLIAGPPIMEKSLTPGTCYMLQFGASGSSRPRVGQLDLRLAHSDPPFPPLEACDNDFAEASNGAGGGRLSRFGCVKAVGLLTAAGGGHPAAIKVDLRTLYNTAPGDPDEAAMCPSRASILSDPPPSLDQFVGGVRYLGTPHSFQDESVPPAPDYIAAQLVCTPEEAVVRDWSPQALAADFPNADSSRVYFYGDTVVPCSVYEAALCLDPADEATCGYCRPLIRTAKTGDCWPPFWPSPGQPSFADINGLVNKFKGISFSPGPTPTGGVPEWYGLMKGNTVGNYDVNPTATVKVGFLDIGVGVDSFKSIPYKETGPCNPDTGMDSCGDPCDTTPGD